MSEPVSPVRRPSTVVFQASPTNINGARATAGLEPDTTLTWGGEAGDEAPAEEA